MAIHPLMFLAVSDAEHQHGHVRTLHRRESLRYFRLVHGIVNRHASSGSGDRTSSSIIDTQVTFGHCINGISSFI